MKKVILLVLIFVLAINVSCSKENQGEVEVISKWELTEVLIDPGDGSGEFKQVDYIETVEFMSNSKVNISTSWCYNETVNTVEYDEISKLIFLECLQNETWRYEVKNGELLIYPNCVEGCINKYKKL